MKALCIVSAVLSTSVFFSPWSTSFTSTILRVKSGRLSSIIASLARLEHSRIEVGSITDPYVAFDMAVLQELRMELSGSSMGRWGSNTLTQSKQRASHVSKPDRQSQHPSRIPGTLV